MRQGLQEPFQDAYQTARKQVIAGTIGTGLVGAGWRASSWGDTFAARGSNSGACAYSPC